jgi:hypothetical protein
MSPQTLNIPLEWGKGGLYLEGIICEFSIGIETVLVNTLEHPLDHGILRLVEFADFAALAAVEGLVSGDEFGLQPVGVCVVGGDVGGRDFGVVRVSAWALRQRRCRDRRDRRLLVGGGEGVAIFMIAARFFACRGESGDLQSDSAIT